MVMLHATNGGRERPRIRLGREEEMEEKRERGARLGAATLLAGKGVLVPPMGVAIVSKGKRKPKGSSGKREKDERKIESEEKEKK